MSTLLDRPVMICRTETTSPARARALEEPLRMSILEALYRKSLSANQIANNLTESGHKKAITTVRHHLEVLKDAGLVEVVKIEETRGAITKYYGTSTKLLGYTVPEDFGAKYSSVIEDTSKQLEKIFHTLASKINSVAKNKKSDRAYSQYVMMEIVNRAMTVLLEKQSHRAKKVSR